MKATLQNNDNWIVPDWPAPASIKALTTLRTGAGFSKEMAGLPAEPFWLNQVHGIDCIMLSDVQADAQADTQVGEQDLAALPKADASIAEQPNQVCVVKTADCLPVLLCNLAGNKVAAIHAGWRGLSAGVLENTIQKFQEKPENILVWLGPGIGPQAFEVGADVLQAFNKPGDEAGFTPKSTDRWLGDLYLLARLRLKRLGIEKIYGGNFCTYTETHRFYSYRRAQNSGRMASMIWIA